MRGFDSSGVIVVIQPGGGIQERCRFDCFLTVECDCSRTIDFFFVLF